jgi:hypothetical protein
MSLTREWRRRRPHRSGHAMYPLTLYRQIQQVRYSRCPAQPPTYLPTCCVATHSSGSADSADKGEQPLFSPKLRSVSARPYCTRRRAAMPLELHAQAIQSLRGAVLENERLTGQLQRLQYLRPMPGVQLWRGDVDRTRCEQSKLTPAAKHVTAATLSRSRVTALCCAVLCCAVLHTHQAELHASPAAGGARGAARQRSE